MGVSSIEDYPGIHTVSGNPQRHSGKLLAEQHGAALLTTVGGVLRNVRQVLEGLRLASFVGAREAPRKDEEALLHEEVWRRRTGPRKQLHSEHEAALFQKSLGNLARFLLLL